MFCDRDIEVNEAAGAFLLYADTLYAVLLCNADKLQCVAASDSHVNGHTDSVCAGLFFALLNGMIPAPVGARDNHGLSKVFAYTIK